jgi:peptidoglycan/LPS O-acetylase OafA/YrhL
MILALIGYAAVYLNKPSKLLSYANATVFPIYILHAPVEYILSYYLKDVEMCFTLKFSIMVIGVFGISWLIYEFGIRRYAWIRPLFGMKRKETKSSG